MEHPPRVLSPHLHPQLGRLGSLKGLSIRASSSVLDRPRPPAHTLSVIAGEIPAQRFQSSDGRRLLAKQFHSLWVAR